MRWIPVVAALAFLLPLPPAGAEEEPGKAKATPPPEGIWWERDFQAGRRRAAREGRPMLFCVNALETEAANQRLGLQTYRSAPWGQATRGYVNFVCNPEDHGGDPCTRYERHVCKGHRDALSWFLKRFGQDLISPQHVILEPDGDVAYRKEYYTGVVGPLLLDTYLSNLAPRVAYARAGIGREKPMKACGTLPLEQLDAFAKNWLDGKDGLAAAALLNVFDDSYDGPRRLAIIHALRHTHDLQVPVLLPAAEERVLYPTDEPDETHAWLRTLFALDRDLGVWAATRALVRVEDRPARDAILRIWGGVGTAGGAPAIGDLPEAERARAYEALLLADDARSIQARVPAAWTRGREAEIERARRLRGRITGAATVDLAALLEAGHAGPLRAGLVGASKAEVRTHAEAIQEGLGTWHDTRLRIAGALALLGARAGPPMQLGEILYAGVNDPVEAQPTRRALAAILGDATPAPQLDARTWLAGLMAWWEGGAR